MLCPALGLIGKHHTRSKGTGMMNERINKVYERISIIVTIL